MTPHGPGRSRPLLLIGLAVLAVTGCSGDDVGSEPTAVTTGVTSDQTAATTGAPGASVTNTPEETASGAEASSVAGGSDADVAELGRFTTRQGFERRYVLVEPGLTDDELIAIAERAHADEPDVWLFVLDDDSEFDTLLAALPETEAGDLSNWPVDFIVEHTVANLTPYLGATEGEWALVRGVDPIYEDAIATFD